MPHIQFFDRSGRELSRREAFEADGRTMRDGVSMRVPFRDSVHRGTVRDARAFWDQHRDTLRVVDPRRVGGTEGLKPGFRIFDNDLGRQAIADAHAAFRYDLENAWRTPSRDAFGFGSYPYGAYPLSAGEGRQCTVDGRPGTLVRQGDVLVCEPLAATVDADKKEQPKPMGRSRCPECDGSGVVHGKTCQGCGGDGWVDAAKPPPDPEEDEDDEDDDGKESATSDRRVLDVDAMSANHQRAMDALYRQISEEVSQQWRRGK